MGGEKFTINAPKFCFGEASLPVKIPVTDGSFGTNFIDLPWHVCTYEDKEA